MKKPTCTYIGTSSTFALFAVLIVVYVCCLATFDGVATAAADSLAPFAHHFICGRTVVGVKAHNRKNYPQILIAVRGDLLRSLRTTENSLLRTKRRHSRNLVGAHRFNYNNTH